MGGPIAGLLAGLGLGAIMGGKKAGGIDRGFMKKLGKDLKPGNAALFMLIPAEDEPTLRHLNSFDAVLYTAPLTDDVEQAIEQATEHEEVLEAIKFDKLD